MTEQTTRNEQAEPVAAIRVGDRIHTGHEAEMAADREATITPEQHAILHITDALTSLQGSTLLDFVPAPSRAEMRASAIRDLETAIDLLRQAGGLTA